MSGEMDRDSKLRIGYFAQHQSDEMDVTLTPYQTMREFIKEVPEHNIRAMLGKFGFDKGKADTKIEELSGGEKARLLFCMMSYNAPHIMLLDEPTNHLDIDARAALIQALNGYDGCVILVSHDPHLVEAVADQLWLVKDGGVEDFTGDLESYRELIVEQRRKERAGSKKEKSEKKNKKRSKHRATTPAELAEKELNQWTEEVRQLEIQMASDKAIEHPDFMNDLLDKYQNAQKQVEKAENDWLQAQNKVDEG